MSDVSGSATATDADDVTIQALDNLLINQVSENIQKALQLVNNLSQLSQIVVNVLFFQTACAELESLLVTLRATQRGGTIHLESLASFRRTLHLTQDRIVANVAQKTDSFFEEAQYDWNARSPPVVGEPNGYLMDLVEFLSTVMMSVLIQLPEFSKDYVYRGALTHCAEVLMVRFSSRDRHSQTGADRVLVSGHSPHSRISWIVTRSRLVKTVWHTWPMMYDG